LGVPGKIKNSVTELHKKRIRMNAEVYVELAKAYLKGYKATRGEKGG
ncbi:gamma carbonic anhydrase family protein, partial [candidate division KSB1 bacterium]